MRVVLVRLSALGDIVHTWPLAVALREADPRLHISWVVEEPFQPLVEGHPAVDAVFVTRTRAWRRRPLSASTRAETEILKTQFHELQPELTIDAQGLLKSAVVTRWTGARRRVGLARPWRRERLAGFSFMQYVDAIIHRKDSPDLPSPEKAFFAELDHLLQGMVGKASVYQEETPAFAKYHGPMSLLYF